VGVEVVVEVGVEVGEEGENLSKRFELSLSQQGLAHAGGHTGQGAGQAGFPQQLGGAQQALGQQSSF